MKLFICGLILLSLYCTSTQGDLKNTSNEDTSYELSFEPCRCPKTEIIVQAKQAIMIQALRDRKNVSSHNISPQLESQIIQENEKFLYDFSVETKDNKAEMDSVSTATGKIKQYELNEFIKENANRPKTYSQNVPEYRSRGLEIIKGFKSDRKKRQTVDEISKNKSIVIYDIKRK